MTLLEEPKTKKFEKKEKNREMNDLTQSMLGNQYQSCTDRVGKVGQVFGRNINVKPQGEESLDDVLKRFVTQQQRYSPGPYAQGSNPYMYPPGYAHAMVHGMK